MQIIEKPINEVTPYEKNPRKNDPAVDAVAKSIQEFGWRQPLVLDAQGVIVAGHTRYKAAKKLKLKTVPCVLADDLTPDQIKAYRIADNSTNSLAEWDAELLLAELADLPQYDFSEFGLTDINELLKGLNDSIEVTEDDFDAAAEAEAITEPITRRGDIWTLGRHRLMCGDSTNGAMVARLMGGINADMVLTDPPYGMRLDTDYSTIKGSLKSAGRKNGTQGNKYEKVVGDNEDFKPELITAIIDGFSSAKEMFLFGADYYAEILHNKNNGSWLVWDKRKESQADAIGAEFELIWSKEKHKRRMLRHDWFGFLSSKNMQDARNRVHPTQKPITLLADIIEQWGKDCKSIVDLYGGSGSTLIAVEQTGRTCFMMELDTVYCDVIVKRYIKHKGGSTDVFLERDGQRIEYDDVSFE